MLGISPSEPTTPLEESNSLWSKLKGLDNYRWATLLAFGISFLLWIVLMILSHGLVGFDWYFKILISCNFLNSIVSSSGYTATIVKGFVTKLALSSSENPTSSIEPTLFNPNGVPVTRPLPKYENRGTRAGAALGVAATVALIVLHEAIPLLQTFSYMAYCLFTFVTLGSFKAIGNRIASCFDTNGSRLSNEKIFIGTAATIGLVLGLVIVFFKAAAIVSLASAATIVTGGAALPLVLAGVMTVTGSIGAMASAADYFSKAVNFCRVKFFNSQDRELTKQVNARPHEYRGAAIGVGSGLVLGVVICCCLIPHVLAAVAAIAVATTVIVACAAVIGSLFSRFGRFMDGFNKSKQEKKETQKIVAPVDNQPKPEPKPQPVTESVTPNTSPEPSISSTATPRSETPTTPPAPVQPRPPEVLVVKMQPESAERYKNSADALKTAPTFFNRRALPKDDVVAPRPNFVIPRCSMEGAAAAAA